MKNNLFSLSIGDCNLYAHSHRNIFAIQANVSLESLKESYLKSVNLSKVTFTKHVKNKNYSLVGLDNSYGAYIEYTLSNEAVKKLLSVGI